MQKTKEMKYQLFDNNDSETKAFCELIDNEIRKYSELVFLGQDSYTINVTSYKVNE
jgi:hypothetical protein